MRGTGLQRGGSFRQGGKSFSASGTAPIIYGITVDNIENIDGIVSSIEALPYHPTVRVVFDQGEPADYYKSAIQAIKATGAFVMGELLDSYYEGGESGTPTTTEQLSVLTTSYLETLGTLVDIWEVGNEVNGNWTEQPNPNTWDGSYSLVNAKLAEAYNLVAAQGYPTALTLYANYTAGDGPLELSPEAFSATQVPDYIRNGLNYVLLSYYEQDNNSVRPTPQVWASHFGSLRTLYPNAWQGFGEIGLDGTVTSATLGTAQSIASYYYGLIPSYTGGSVPLPYYCGGYFWWYWYEDCIPDTTAFFPSIHDGFIAEKNALG